MSDEVFQRYSAYYDLLYRDKDYPAEANYVLRTLRTADPKIRRVVEFGSGTGKHGRLLAAGGLQVTGVERSATMVGVSNDCDEPVLNDGSFNCIHGDIRTANAGTGFDAVISLFHVVSYLTQNDDLISTFQNAGRHLRSRGIFFFDVWHGPAVLSERPSIRVKRVEDERTRLIRIAEPQLDIEGSRVTVRYTMLAENRTDCHLTTFQEEHLMRYFFPNEIAFIASQTGFEVAHSEEFLSGTRSSEKTWGVAYLLRRLT